MMLDTIRRIGGENNARPVCGELVASSATEEDTGGFCVGLIEAGFVLLGTGAWTGCCKGVLLAVGPDTEGPVSHIGRLSRLAAYSPIQNFSVALLHPWVMIIPFLIRDSPVITEGGEIQPF